MSFSIDTMTPSDWDRVRQVYLDGIATGHATFETDAPDWETWDREHLAAGRLVARDQSGVIGWAALAPVSGRCVYGGVAEVSVYISSASRGRGVGRALLQALVTASEQGGIWTLEAGVFPENTASIAIHRACGFREIGRRERLGKLHDRWRDVILLERRSETVGTG